MYGYVGMTDELYKLCFFLVKPQNRPWECHHDPYPLDEL